MKNLAHLCGGREFPDGPNGLKDVKLGKFRMYSHTIEDAAREFAARKCDPKVLIVRDAAYDAAFEERIQQLHKNYSCVEVTGKELLDAFLPPKEIREIYKDKFWPDNDGNIRWVDTSWNGGWSPDQVFGIPCATGAEQNKILPIWIPDYGVPTVVNERGLVLFVKEAGKCSSHDLMIGLHSAAGQWFVPHFVLPSVPEEKGAALAAKVALGTYETTRERLPTPMHPERRRDDCEEIGKYIGSVFLV